VFFRERSFPACLYLLGFDNISLQVVLMHTIFPLHGTFLLIRHVCEKVT
jgi:hypothetical protein